MDAKEKLMAKEYINDSISDIELVFFNREQDRLANVKFPFYDGGITPIMMYYARKYKLPIKFPTYIENIKGETIFEITSNFYTYNSTYNLVTKNIDLFSTEYVKNYFFFNKFYNFEVIYNKLYDFYSKKLFNTTNEEYLWVTELNIALLSMLALKEKPSLGVKNDKNFNKYYEFIKKITEEYLTLNEKKNKLSYLRIFWMYQLLEPESEVIKKEGIERVSFLLKSRKNKQLWKFQNGIQYIHNWIFYGIVKDYLYENFENFLNTYSLKEITEGMIFEPFANPSKKSKSKSNNKSNKSGKSKKNKEKFDDVKKDKKSSWITLMTWILLPIFIFLGIRIMLFFWGKMLSMVKY